MPRYQIDIRAPEVKQTFVTEDLDDQAAKTRLKSFIDVTLSLRDYIIDIRPLNTKSERGRRIKTELRQQECFYERGRICPLGDDQSGDTCLHCDGRGL